MEMTENEQKKDYLWGYRRAIRKQKQIEDEIVRLRLDKISPGLQQDGMPRGSGGSDLSGYAARWDELMDELRQQGEECIRIRREIVQRIENVGDETEILLLKYRYIIGLKWEDIAEKMEYSWGGIHKVHGNALKHLKIKNSVW